MDDAKKQIKDAYKAYQENRIDYNTLCEKALEISEREGESLDTEVQEAIGEICRLHTTWDMVPEDTQSCENDIERLLHS